MRLFAIAAVGLHILAAVVWVGGMFFAYMCLRPAAGPMEPPDRLALWGRGFERFFPWVWASVVVLPVTGNGMIFFVLGGFASAGMHVHLMQAVGWVMILLFIHLWFAPYGRFKRALAADDQAEAGRYLNQIRLIIAINLMLGLLTALIGATGRYWG
jgi:uncharacterized membrane protein